MGDDPLTRDEFSPYQKVHMHNFDEQMITTKHGFDLLYWNPYPLILAFFFRLINPLNLF